MQRSLFIAKDYLGFRRRKVRFLQRSILENNIASCTNGAWPGANGARGSPCGAKVLCFRPVFDRSSVWKLLGTWNDFFTLYCLQSSFPWSFGWCLDLSSYMISHYKTMKNTYVVAWFRINVNYNDSSENNTICFSKHWQLL